MKNDKARTRITAEAHDISYDAARSFFEARGGKYNPEHPYVATSYQDSNPGLAEARDAHEKATALPLLRVSAESRVLDIGCGVGRWADALAPKVAAYLGLDFSASLVQVASTRIAEQFPEARAHFQQMPFQRLAGAAPSDFAVPPPFSCAIIAGVMAYINDADLPGALAGLARLLAPKAVLYVREPIGKTARLTLDRHPSEELAAEYSAIYRTVSDYERLLRHAFPAEGGFSLTLSRELLAPALSNRAETSQHIFIVERGYV